MRPAPRHSLTVSATTPACRYPRQKLSLPSIKHRKLNELSCRNTKADRRQVSRWVITTIAPIATIFYCRQEPAVLWYYNNPLPVLSTRPQSDPDTHTTNNTKALGLLLLTRPALRPLRQLRSLANVRHT